MIEQFRLFVDQQALQIVSEKTVQGGIQFVISDGQDAVHCTFYRTGIVLPQGKKSGLFDLISAWSGRQAHEMGFGDALWADFYMSWREWWEDANWLGDYIDKNGIPNEEEATDQYKIHREIMFHDFMFRAEHNAIVTEETLVFVIRNWLNHFCFMGLNAEQLIADVIADARENQRDPHNPTFDIANAANSISRQMCHHCTKKFLKQGNKWICPQVKSDQNGCASEVVDALYPYSSAGRIVAYTKTNLQKLIKRKDDIKWIDFTSTSPIENSMADGLKQAGLLYIPQYQACTSSKVSDRKCEELMETFH